ncbi:MAG: cytochrome c [Chitinophagales bacterium]|nr:cytochrome c [Chitinophagales bacterium]
MKRILKIGGSLILLLVIILAVGFIVINNSDIPTYEVEKIEVKVTPTAESIERGHKLVSMLCASCHKDPATGKLTGTRMPDAPPEFGVVYSPNITQDKKYGIGEWTDGEIYTLLRTGVKKNGQYAPPYMVKLPHMADEDLHAIIGFLRSGHKLVAADPTPDKPSEPSFLTKLLCKIEWKPFPFPEKEIQLPDSSETLELGKYLAHNLDCFVCHSADFKTNNYLEPELSKGYFAGGNKPYNREGRVVLSSNLTPHPESGIGKWTKEQFISAVKFGIMENEAPLQYPMLPYSALEEYEVNAIYEYLKTIPPIDNPVKRSLYDS